MVRILVALGSNAMDSPRFVGDGWLAAVAALGLVGARLSRVVVSRPAEGVDGGAFCNAVGAGDCDLPPAIALARLHDVEASFGRTRTPGAPPAARTLDLDLIDWGGRVIAEPGLTLPHPRLHQRDFVLAPIAELEPTFVDARSGRSVAELLRDLPERFIVPAAEGPLP